MQGYGGWLFILLIPGPLTTQPVESDWLNESERHACNQNRKLANSPPNRIYFSPLFYFIWNFNPNSKSRFLKRLLESKWIWKVWRRDSLILTRILVFPLAHFHQDLRRGGRGAGWEWESMEDPSRGRGIGDEKGKSWSRTMESWVFVVLECGLGLVFVPPPCRKDLREWELWDSGEVSLTKDRKEEKKDETRTFSSKNPRKWSKGKAKGKSCKSQNIQTPWTLLMGKIQEDRKNKPYRDQPQTLIGMRMTSFCFFFQNLYNNAYDLSCNPFLIILCLYWIHQWQVS